METTGFAKRTLRKRRNAPSDHRLSEVRDADDSRDNPKSADDRVPSVQRIDEGQCCVDGDGSDRCYKKSSQHRLICPQTAQPSR
jgi:hypothetical protein